MADEDLMTFTSQPYRSTLCHFLNRQRLGNQFCDLRILAEDEVFPAHSSVLRAASPILMRALAPYATAGVSHELLMRGLSGAACNDLLTLLYTGRLQAPRARFHAVMAYAHHLEVRIGIDDEDAAAAAGGGGGGPREPMAKRLRGNRLGNGKAPAAARSVRGRRCGRRVFPSRDARNQRRKSLAAALGVAVRADRRREAEPAAAEPAAAEPSEPAEPVAVAARTAAGNAANGPRGALRRWINKPPPKDNFSTCILYQCWESAAAAIGGRGATAASTARHPPWAVPAASTTRVENELALILGDMRRASVAEQARLRQERYSRRNAIGLASGRAEPPAEPPRKKGPGASAAGRRALPNAVGKNVIPMLVEQPRPGENGIFGGDAAEGCFGATLPTDGGRARRRGHTAGPGGCDLARGDAGGGSGVGRGGIAARGGGDVDDGGRTSDGGVDGFTVDRERSRIVDADRAGGSDDDAEIVAAAAALVAGDAGCVRAGGGDRGDCAGGRIGGDGGDGGGIGGSEGTLDETAPRNWALLCIDLIEQIGQSEMSLVTTNDSDHRPRYSETEFAASPTSLPESPRPPPPAAAAAPAVSPSPVAEATPPLELLPTPAPPTAAFDGRCTPDGVHVRGRSSCDDLPAVVVEVQPPDWIQQQGL